MTRKFEVVRDEIFGRLPEGVEVPLVPASRWRIRARQVALALRIAPRLRACRKRRPAFLAGAKGRVEAIRDRIRSTEDASILVGIWNSEVAPLFRDALPHGRDRRPPGRRGRWSRSARSFGNSSARPTRTPSSGATAESVAPSPVSGP